VSRRRVMPYSPTWGDKHFQKGFRDALQNLNKAKREEVTRKRQQELTNLFEALRTASDLITDPRVRRWRPTPFKGVVTLRKGRLIEYRCQGLFRLIVIDRPEENLVLLFAATAEHDFERLKRQLRDHRGALDVWEPDHPGEEEKEGAPI